MEKGWKYAYRDRKQRKREFRGLWITRINAAAREHGLSYSRLIHGLKEAGIEMAMEAPEDGTGPAAAMLFDPDGNPILLDQHVPRPGR